MQIFKLISFRNGQIGMSKSAYFSGSLWIECTASWHFSFSSIDKTRLAVCLPSIQKKKNITPYIAITI